MTIFRYASLLTCSQRCINISASLLDRMKVAVIGQSLFGAQVYQRLIKNGHPVSAVFTVPDINGREDPLAAAARQQGTKVFKFPRWRLKGKVIPEVLDQYNSVGADLNVLAFCSQFIPMEVITAPKNRSIVYHPSLLPVHRGASAINWTLINGDSRAGLSVFWADDGLDTGPVLLQRECKVSSRDTVDSLYTRFLLPEGVRATVEAVRLIELCRAPSIEQFHEDATYEPIVKKATAEIRWDEIGTSGWRLHNFIRGHDKIPGAWSYLEDEKVTFYGSQLWYRKIPVEGRALKIRGLANPAILHSQGLLIPASDGQWVNISQLKFEDTGKTIQANMYGKVDEIASINEFTEDEMVMEGKLKTVWNSILPGCELDENSDFFKLGAGSMDVTRLVEEVQQATGQVLETEDVYMRSEFGMMFRQLVFRSRQTSDGGDARGASAAGKDPTQVDYDAAIVTANGMQIPVPHQLFINNEFVDSDSGKTFRTVNPTNESVICDVSLGSRGDVDRAVSAAKEAFEFGEWGKMNARDRGKLMHRLADLMEQNKEILATLESVDSGAVYTLALKTHVGMSVDTFRYFAGWCDKIQGSVIPINHARPNKNLTITKKEPIGVCGIVVPWNYPLMMLAWKMAACIAAGNTVVLKPAMVTPLTALKFCELVREAKFPPGVINVIPGAGSLVGQHLGEHPDVRKLGFTGSTEIGKTIMKTCATSNLKKCSLELGGKSPFIIFADCDRDKAVKFIISSVFFNKGENCIAAGRIFLEEDVHDEILELLVAEVGRMRVGDPLDRSTEHGPQNHEAHLLKLLEYCEIGQKEGARLVCGGKRCERQGYFMQPTIFTDVSDDMYIAKEESFGPVMVISKFRDIDEVIVRANSTEYGLASGVFSTDITKCLRVSDGLDAGTVFVNTYNKTDVAAPFGGFKQSGFGKDLGQDALNEYLKTKTVTMEY